MSIGRFLGYGIFGILALLVVLNFESVFAQQNNTIDIETPAKVQFTKNQRGLY
jgi:hypothetical protein